MQRYFLKTPVEKTFELDADIQHHFVTVLRAVEGTQAEFVRPDHTVFIGAVSALTGESTTISWVNDVDVDVELPVEATIIAGLPKGDKPELIVQKATELGVHHIIFVPTKWSVAKWNGKEAKKIARLQKIADGAAEQAHRTVQPVISYANSLRELMANDYDVKIVAWEESAKQGEQAALVAAYQQLQPGQKIVAVFGPEGGLTPEEVGMLGENGYQAAALGPRILRTETAPLYWLSSLSFFLELIK